MSRDVDNLTVTTQTRNIRYAFLLEESCLSHELLDKIIFKTQSFWGGRFSPIILCRSNDISDDYWSFLVGNDPDVIISNFTLSEDLIDKINRHILPLKIVETTLSEDGKSWVIPWDFEGISTASFPEIVETPSFVGKEPYHLRIFKDRLEGSHYNFVLQTFGITREEFIFKTFLDRAHGSSMNASDIISIFSYINESRDDVITPNFYSSLFASPHYDNKYDSSTSEFHLVIGDSVKERIYSWNRYLLGRMNCNGIHTIWIPNELSGEEEIFKELVKYIGKKFYSYDNLKSAKVVSFSVEEEKLKEIAERLQNLSLLYVGTQILDGSSLPIGESDPVVNMGRVKYQSRLSSTVGFSKGRAIISCPSPRMFSEKNLTNGKWIGQFKIQFRPEGELYSNSNSAWHTPRIVGLADAFFEQKIARSDRDGWLVTYLEGHQGNLTLKIPSGNEILQKIAWQQRYNLERKGRDLPEKPEYLDFPISEEGKSVNGVIRLFGDIEQFGTIFGDAYWREVFFSLAKSSSQDREERARIIKNKLKEFIANGCYNGVDTDDLQLDELADSISRSIRPSSKNEETVTIKALNATYNILRNKAESKELFLNEFDFRDKDWGRINDIQSFLNQKILIQGCLVACKSCKTPTWYNVDNISNIIKCKGCSVDNNFPVDPVWRYRLNPFLINLLQDKGAYNVIRTLVELQEFCDGMFFFKPSFDVYSYEKKKRLTDVDIFVIKEGKLIIGEVKSTPTGFLDQSSKSLSGRNTYKYLISVFKPNEFIFASECDEFPNEVKSEIEKFRIEMKDFEITVREICLKWR